MVVRRRRGVCGGAREGIVVVVVGAWLLVEMARAGGIVFLVVSVNGIARERERMKERKKRGEGRISQVSRFELVVQCKRGER